MNGKPGKLILDGQMNIMFEGACPTSTSCLFSGAQSNTNDPLVVPVDRQGNPRTAVPAPEAGTACRVTSTAGWAGTG
jgi:hypothetical protein